MVAYLCYILLCIRFTDDCVSVLQMVVLQMAVYLCFVLQSDQRLCCLYLCY